MTTTSPREAWVDTFLRASAETSDARLVADQFIAAGWRPPLPDSETEPDSWEAGAYIEPDIGGVANVSTSGWPGGVEHVWLRVSDYARDDHGADIVLEPDEADEIAGVLRGAAQSVRRDRGEVTS